MTDAPERVWMDPDIQFPYCEKQYGCDVEYVRADLIDDMVQEAVADALAKAAECCTAELRNTAMLMSNPPKSSAAWDARNAIRDLLKELKGQDDE